MIKKLKAGKKKLKQLNTEKRLVNICLSISIKILN